MPGKSNVSNGNYSFGQIEPDQNRCGLSKSASRVRLGIASSLDLKVTPGSQQKMTYSLDHGCSIPAFWPLTSNSSCELRLFDRKSLTLD